MVKYPAIALLKAHAKPQVVPHAISVSNILPRFMEDKGYSQSAALELANSKAFGSLVSQLLHRSANQSGDERDQAILWNYFASRTAPTATHKAIRTYRGAPADSVLADKFTTMLSSPSAFVGEGATSLLSVRRVQLPRKFYDTRIAIVGAGPAGLMLNRALYELGFRNAELFDKRQEYGIWSQPNVSQGSRNNPRDVVFDNIARLTAAPGGGDEVPRFLRDLIVRHPERRVIKSIKPGNLDHTLVFDGGHEEKYPIVINAMGTGKPTPVSDPLRMVGPEARVIAKRWQEPTLERDRVKKKMFIFIGLGNSTAEMIRQMHDFQDQGIDVDYRILTHYPKDAVFNPSDTVHVGETGYRVFRDISKPQLVSYQGDLPVSRSDYYRALLGGRIISDVKRWDVDGKHLVAYPEGSEPVEMNYDEMYILTGYRHSPEDYAAMGCTWDNELGCALHDYDGEIIKAKNAIGGDRVHRGYFGFGAVLDAPHNPNTVVIPGMAYRLPDLLFSIVMRAGEHTHR